MNRQIHVSWEQETLDDRTTLILTFDYGMVSGTVELLIHPEDLDRIELMDTALYHACQILDRRVCPGP